MPKFFQKKEKRNNKKSITLKSRWDGFLKVLAYFFLVVAVSLFTGGLFWQRAGIELMSKNISGMSQWKALWIFLVEYFTDPGAITGFASLILSIVIFSLERDKDIKERLEKMRSLPYLQRLRRYIELEKEAKKKFWPSSRVDDLQQDRISFLEYEFWWAVGECIQKEESIKELLDIQNLYNYFFTAHKSSVEVLAGILTKSKSQNDDVFALIAEIMKLWDKFDIEVKDVIIYAFRELSLLFKMENISADELEGRIFYSFARRRLLRDNEIKTLFPLLKEHPFPPAEYDARWKHFPHHLGDSKILNWLKQHDLILNPFGPNDIKHYPFYPDGFVHPDQWTRFSMPEPTCGQCPTVEDAKALAFLFQFECLSVKQLDRQRDGFMAFPVWVSFEQAAHMELPLIVLARSTAQAWMDILPLSPDALLDLPPAKQQALLELLCWAFYSNHAVIDLLKRVGFSSEKGGRLLVHKLERFESKYSVGHFPQDAILYSWLNIRPPDLNYTYLILSIDEFPPTARSTWLEQFTPLISTLFLNGIVTKTFISSNAKDMFPLSIIGLDWSDAKLKKSLDSQFSNAVETVDGTKQKEVRFIEFFGSGSFGYAQTEKSTTDRLISASHNSLAHMLTLGNRLLRYHCEKRGVSEKYLSLQDLDYILNSA